mgnify:FL=1
MLKKFLEDECKGYTVQARYDELSETVIFHVFKEDVDVSKVIHRFDVAVNESWNELIIVDTLRRMLREADKKFEEYKANKGKIKKVDKTDDDT